MPFIAQANRRGQTYWSIALDATDVSFSKWMRNTSWKPSGRKGHVDLLRRVFLRKSASACISAIAVGRLGQVVTDIFVVHGEKTLFQNVSLGGSVEADVHLCEGSWVVSRGAPAALYRASRYLLLASRNSNSIRLHLVLDPRSHSGHRYDVSLCL